MNGYTSTGGSRNAGGREGVRSLLGRAPLKNPKWHFIRVVGTLMGVPYQRPLPYEADDLREGNPTPRFRLLIKRKATDRILYEQKLSGAAAANEAMRTAESDLEVLSAEDFHQKYAMPDD